MKLWYLLPQILNLCHQEMRNRKIYFLHIYCMPLPVSSKTGRVLRNLQNTELQGIIVLDMDEESSLEEGEIGNSSSPIEQSDSLQGVGPSTTACFTQEEIVSNLVQFLKAGPCKHVIVGIIKGILEELSKFNIDNLDAFFKSSEYIGTTTIQTFGGNTSHWTAFCAFLANNIHELTNLCKPIICNPSVHEAIAKWEIEFEKLKELEQKESYIRCSAMKLRINRDSLILELYKKTAITININGSMVDEIQQQEAKLEGLAKELKEVNFKRKEVADQCNEFLQLVVQLDSNRLQREIDAHSIYWRVCATLKSLIEKLEEPINNDL